MKDIEIIPGDCLEVMKTMPDKSVDLVLTDPPYGIGMDNQKVRTKPSRPNTRGRGGELQYHEQEWDSPIEKRFFDEMFRISKYQVIWGANYYCSFLPNGFGWLYWDKQMGDNSFSSGEFAFQSRFVKASSFSFPSMRVNGTRNHPTQKPIELMRWCLSLFPDAGRRPRHPYPVEIEIPLCVQKLPRKVKKTRFLH